MKKLLINELLSLEEYRRQRHVAKSEILKVKNYRRIIVGPYLNFLFENRETMLYQIHEMIYAENIIKHEAIKHELDTYNELVPAEYELKATLLIEFEETETRRVKLKELVGLEKKISLVIDDAIQIPATYDINQIDEDKISSVQFLTFHLGKENTSKFLQTNTVKIVTSHHACNFSTQLSLEQLQALKEDLSK